MRGTLRFVWMKVVVALALTLVLVGGMVATASASPLRGPTAGPQPNAPTCTYKHWAYFESASTPQNNYVVDAYGEGLYDNYNGTFCGGVRGHLAVYIPAFQVGGATYISFSYDHMYNNGTASNAGSSGYWYNLYTSTTYAVECGYTTGSFTPAGGTTIFATTSNLCAS